MSRFQKVCLIEVQQEGQPTLTRLYEQNTLLLGRSTEVQIGISDPGVSRNHLEITRKNGKIWITDLGSANGTFVNGTQLTAHAKTVYNLGDPIQVGSQRIQISINIIEKAFD